MRFSIAASVSAMLLSLASSTSAVLDINNWCYEPIYIWQSIDGGCQTGSNQICLGSAGASPLTIPAHTIHTLDLVANGQGTSVKIATNPMMKNGILQFEYTTANNVFYWDLSDLDGAGPNAVGSPFFNHNVKVSPTGAGLGQGTCQQIRCPKGTLCQGAYNAPEETKTKGCPANTGPMWLNLCEPEAWFAKSKRAVLPRS